MIHEINLEAGHPDVNAALRQLEFYLANVRVGNGRTVKVIHGYGSTGKGGRIRSAVRKYLKESAEKGKITLWIKGENFSIFDASTRYILDKCPEASDDPDLGKANPGVTWIYL